MFNSYQRQVSRIVIQDACINSGLFFKSLKKKKYKFHISLLYEYSIHFLNIYNWYFINWKNKFVSKRLFFLERFNRFFFYNFYYLWQNARKARLKVIFNKNRIPIKIDSMKVIYFNDYYPPLSSKKIKKGVYNIGFYIGFTKKFHKLIKGKTKACVTIINY